MSLRFAIVLAALFGAVLIVASVVLEINAHTPHAPSGYYSSASGAASQS
jgi:hypothetical protein